MASGLAWLKQRLDLLKIKLPSGKNSWWTFVIALAVFIFLGLSLRKDWKTILTYNWQIHWADLVIMALLHSLALGSMLLAWHFTMHRLGKQDNWRHNFHIFSVSMLARRIPVPIWYVGSRVYLYREIQVSTSIVLTATILETALIALSGVLCYVLLLPWYTYTTIFPWQILAGIAGLVTFALLIRPALFIDLINLVLHWLKKGSITAEITRRDLLLWTLLYLATWFIDGLGLYYTVSAFLVTPPPLPSVIGVSTISALVGLASMALPGGFGLKEITMGALLGSWIPVTAGIVISIIYRLLQTIIETLWAFVGQKMPEDPPPAAQ
jgi:glycosyltransferase 2 family protein